MDDTRMASAAPNTPRPGFLASPVTHIRLGSLLFVFLMLGHMSAYPWSSANSLQEARLVDGMKSIDFNFMGERSSYWSLYFGWGLLVGVLLFTMAAMLWLLSDLARLAPRRVGAMAGLVSGVCAVGAYLSFRFFYVPPFLAFVAIGVILFSVAVRLLKTPAELLPAAPARS
jgi:hypothetical protein